MFESDNVYSSLSPIYFFSKLTAVSSVSVSRDGVRRSFLGLFYPLCCAFVFFLHTSVETIYYRKRKGSKLFIILDIVQTSESIFATIVIYFCANIYSNKIIAWTNKVHAFDELMRAQFKNVDYNGSHKKIRTFGVISSCYAFIHCSFIFVIDLFGYLPRNISLGYSNGVVTYTVPSFVSSFMILQFSASMLIMKERFRWINEELSVLVRTWKKNSRIRRKDFVRGFEDLNWRSNEEAFIDVLEKLRIKYYDIHSLTEELNAIFAVSSVLMILQCFLSLLVYILYLIRPKKRSWYKALLFRWFGGSMVSLNAIKLSTISYTSSFLSSEAKRTEAILHQIESTSEDINDFVQVFSYQTLELKTQITACNLFTIDRPLIYKVVALITNYLVVCIQLDL